MAKTRLTFEERRIKAAKSQRGRTYLPRSKGPRYHDGTNVRAKLCECDGKIDSSNEYRCFKCGREKADTPLSPDFDVTTSSPKVPQDY